MFDYDPADIATGVVLLVVFVAFAFVPVTVYLVHLFKAPINSLKPPQPIPELQPAEPDKLTAKFVFEHGEAVKDIFSDYKGIVVGRADYKHYSSQYGVWPQDGTPVGSLRWIPEHRLVSDTHEVTP